MQREAADEAISANAIGFSGCICFFLLYNSINKCVQNRRNRERIMRTCIITGANSGIGKNAAMQLASQGLRVILACRNIEQAEDVCAQIQEQTGNQEVYVRKVDLSLAADSRRFAQEFMAEFASLDVLINNAADFDLSRKKPIITCEGNETQFATNLLSPFILMTALLPLLRKSSDGRIINISSKGLVMRPNITFEFDNIKSGRGYSPAKTYYQTKLGLLMVSLFMREHLSESNVSVFAVRVTNVKVDISRYSNISTILKAMYRIKSRFAISPQDMAKAYVALAHGAKVKGFLYDEKLQEVRCNAYAYDRAAQEKLWHVCEGLANANN